MLSVALLGVTGGVEEQLTKIISEHHSLDGIKGNNKNEGIKFPLEQWC